MKTAFQTGPGFYAAETHKVNPTIKPGEMRIYCVRLEAYDLEVGGGDNDITFEIVFAKVEKDPHLAKALLKLGDAIEANRAGLEQFTGE